MTAPAISLPIIEGIYDIQPLPEPAPGLFESSLIITTITIILVAVVFLIWKHYFSLKFISKRRITQLYLNYSSNNLSAHDTIYLLSKILRQGLDIKSISEKTILPEKLLSEKEKWCNFSKNFSILRYAKKEHTEQDIKNIINQSQFWLKHWR